MRVAKYVPAKFPLALLQNTCYNRISHRACFAGDGEIWPNNLARFLLVVQRACQKIVRFHPCANRKMVHNGKGQGEKRKRTAPIKESKKELASFPQTATITSPTNGESKMPNTLTPAFANLSSFDSLVDAYNANPCPRGNITRNDLVRAWNILGTLRSQASTNVTLRYVDINISQSSVRTIVSKLNTLFRHVGLLTPAQGITITYADFFHANIACADLDLSGLSWEVASLANTRGRRQDRVDTRHEDGHRARRNGRNAPLFPPRDTVAYPAPTAMVQPANIANLAALVEGFNAFEGIGSDIFLALQAEAE